MGELQGTLAAVGGPAPGLSLPLPGSVRIVNTRTHASRIVPVSSDGQYSVAISPGTYTIVGRSPLYGGGTGFYCEAAGPAVVTADRVTATGVYCQMS